MRLFFAVVVPEEVVARVAEAQERLRALAGDDGIRWTRPEQFHYTLKFLGEQPSPRAHRAVESALALREGIPRLDTFELALGGLGAFPTAERPSVLWAGATAGAEALTGLAARLDALLVRQGFSRENRLLKAHLTLARVKTYHGEIAARRALQKLPADAAADLGAFTVDRFVLMQSTLRPEGSQYAVVEEFEFKQG
jgi:2'-5' RNA ligase